MIGNLDQEEIAEALAWATKSHAQEFNSCVTEDKEQVAVWFIELQEIYNDL